MTSNRCERFAFKWTDRTTRGSERHWSFGVARGEVLNARARRENPHFEGCRDSVVVKTACKRWILEKRSGVREVSSSRFGGS